MARPVLKLVAAGVAITIALLAAVPRKARADDLLSVGLAALADQRKADEAASAAAAARDKQATAGDENAVRADGAAGESQAVDLISPTVFRPAGTPGWLVGAVPDLAAPERKPRGLSLGDDTKWQVQAAQVGVMTAAFAALVALCKGGGCMW